MAEEAIETLQLRLMGTWGIRRDSLSHWMNSEREESRKPMARSRSTGLISQGSQNGRTKRSQRNMVSKHGKANKAKGKRKSKTKKQ